MGLSLVLRRTVEEVGRGDFERLTAAREYPFLSFNWLSALERSGAVSGETGWDPLHLVVQDERGTLVAFVPGYLKSHSMGEFVFDHGIAEFSEHRLREPYYPKLVFAVPFTPATGPKILYADGAGEAAREEARELIADAIPFLLEKLGASSAHFLFPLREEAEFLRGRGHLVRTGIQFQYHRDSALTFDDYLKRFNAKRRSTIRRERRDTASLVIDSLSGAGIRAAAHSDPEFPKRIFELYLTTIDKYSWGRRYLNLEFFREVLETMPEQLQLIVARETAESPPVAMAMNLVGEHALYGRYWGCHKELSFLHFEACLYRGVEETIARRLTRFEPGAGGEHKESRGFAPTPTLSTSLFRNPMLTQVTSDFYERERLSLVTHYSLANEESSGR